MNWKDPLKGMIGQKGVDTLSKAIHRRDSDSTIGPLDVYLPLLVIPRTILSWLVQNIKPMPVGERKSLVFPGMEDIEIKIDKQGRDSYRGEFVRDGRVIHSFEKQTLPNVGGNIMSFGEIYEDSPEQDQPQKLTPDMAMPQVMMQMLSSLINQPKPKEINSDVVLSLTSSLGKLVDALVSNKITEQNVKNAINSVKEPEEPVIVEEKEDVTIKEALEETPVKDLSKEKVSKSGDIEEPSGQAAPVKPDGIMEPKKPSMQPQSKQSYFKQRLNRSKGIEKKEKTYHIAGHEIYTPCVHCGVPEFEKSEEGPKYKPCACFSITMKSKDGSKSSFVNVIKKSEGGFSLAFNKNADKDMIEAFLLTLRNKLLEYKDNLT